MVEGLRDAFIENDVVGNYNLNTNFLGNFSSRNRRKKVKKRRRKVRHSQMRHRVRRIKKSHKIRKVKVHKKRRGRKYPYWLKKYWFKKQGKR